MTTFLDIALSYIRRGWYIFPCIPGDKKPIKGVSGYLDASNSEDQIRAWWAATPNANVAIATGKSGLVVLDIDTGPKGEADLRALMAAHDLPETYTVRTGKRTAYAVQLYYSGGDCPSFNHWAVGDYGGDVRGSTHGHVMAAGCIHPDSGERYEVLWDRPIAPAPNWVRALKPVKKEREALTDPNAPITEWRNDTLYRVLCKHRANCADDDMIRDYALRINARMPNPLDEEELETVITNACKQPMGEPEPIVVLGTPKEPQEPVDWRSLFHSKEEALNAPPVTFLIKDFLQREGVTAVAGPVRERKSLIALNIAHALVTGEKLFGHFPVVRKPERVLYLCPEVSLGPFTDRLKKIGLLDYVGETLFYRTLSAEGTLSLKDPALAQALPGSVVILDTAIRFLEGDENSSQDVRAFADGIFELLRAGAEAIVLLHHSPKDSGDMMTLENAMRGSGDMGAFLCCCWGTKLQDPAHPYESPSFLSNLKQRDFESKDIEVTCTPDCRMHIVGDPATRTVTLQSRKGNRANKDGLDDAAEAAVRANIKLPVRKLQEQLAALNISRGTTWIAKARARIQAETGEMTVGG